MIDYFLSSSKLFFHILDFEIKNFTPNLSDVHSQLHISLKIPKKENALTADENERSERNQARKWCSEKSQEYLQNLVSDDRLQNIIDTIDTIFIRHEHGELLSDRDINSVIDDIGTFVFALHLNHHVTNYFLYQKRFWHYHQTMYQYRQ
jgi:hypothetical protein